MRARMQPVERVFANLPRMVRDLAAGLNKKIDLVTEGGDTELDRQLIELIRDPLTHLVRNCADHGIEPPDERVRLGKPAAGTVRVAAAHEAGQITIEISDDGRGLDKARIEEKALALGLVDAAQLKRDERRGDLPLHFRAGLFDRRTRHQCIRARRRHGCRAREHPGDRRLGAL